MLIHRIRSYVNSKLVRCIDLGIPPNTLTVGKDLSNASGRSADRIKRIAVSDLSEESLLKVENRIRSEIQQSFTDGTWIKTLPGRDIIRQFIEIDGVSLKYEVFRNLLLSRMADQGKQPDGMKKIIDQIRTD